MENSIFPIANWYFAMWPGIVPVDPLQPMVACEAWFSMADRCLSVLEKYRLLNITRVNIEGWCRTNRNKDADDYWIRRELDVPNNHNRAGNLLQSILQKWSYTESDGSLVVPMKMVLFGETAVSFDEPELAAVKEIACVDLDYSYGWLVGDFIVNVKGGWWLPYSLDGKLFNSKYEDLASRLEKAMTEIELLLEIEPDYESVTDYCYVKDYRLDNLKDCDGKILGIDEYGHCLPSDGDD